MGGGDLEHKNFVNNVTRKNFSIHTKHRILNTLCRRPKGGLKRFFSSLLYQNRTEKTSKVVECFLFVYT